jgi:hypothetical protein
MMGQLHKVDDRFVFEQGEMTMTIYALNRNRQQTNEWQTVQDALKAASGDILNLLNTGVAYINAVFGIACGTEAAAVFAGMSAVLDKWASNMTTSTNDQESFVWVDDSLSSAAETDALHQPFPKVAVKNPTASDLADTLIHESAHGASTKIIDLAYNEAIEERLPGDLRLRNADHYKITVLGFTGGSLTQFRQKWAIQPLSPGEKALLAAQVFMNIARVQVGGLIGQARQEASLTGGTWWVMAVGNAISGSTLLRATLQSAQVTIWPLLQQRGFAATSWTGNPITQDEFRALRDLLAPVWDLNKAIQSKNIGLGNPSQGQVEFVTGNAILLNVPPNQTCDDMRDLIITKLITVGNSFPGGLPLLKELVGMYYKLRHTSPISFAQVNQGTSLSVDAVT